MRRPRLTGAVSADVLDLGVLMPKPDLATAPTAEAGEAGKVFRAAALQLPALPPLDVHLEVGIARLRLPREPAAQGLTAPHSTVRARGETVEARPPAFKVAGGAVSGAAALRVPCGGSKPAFKLQVHANGVALNQVLAPTGNARSAWAVAASICGWISQRAAFRRANWPVRKVAMWADRRPHARGRRSGRAVWRRPHPPG